MKRPANKEYIFLCIQWLQAFVVVRAACREIRFLGSAFVPGHAWFFAQFWRFGLLHTRAGHENIGDCQIHFSLRDKWYFGVS